MEAKNLKQQFDNEIENKIKIKDKFFNCRGCRSVEAEIKAMVYCMNNLRQYFYNKKMIDISYFNNKDLTGIRDEVFEIIVDFIKNVIVYTRPIRECINAFCNIKREIGKLQDYIVDEIWGMPCDKASQISEIRRCVNRLVEGYEIKEKIQQYRNNKKDFFDSLKKCKNQFDTWKDSIIEAINGVKQCIKTYNNDEEIKNILDVFEYMFKEFDAALKEYDIWYRGTFFHLDNSTNMVEISRLKIRYLVENFEYPRDVDMIEKDKDEDEKFVIKDGVDLGELIDSISRDIILPK